MMSSLSAFERFKEKIIGKIDARTRRCWFHHDWGQWKDVRREECFTTFILLQERRCQRCGRAQIADRSNW